MHKCMLIYYVIVLEHIILDPKLIKHLNLISNINEQLFIYFYI